LPALSPGEHKSGEQADDYQKSALAKGIAGQELLKSAAVFLEAPTLDESKGTELSKSTGGDLVHGASVIDEAEFFRTNAVIDRIAPLKVIQPITNFPDWVTATLSSMAILLRTLEGWFYLEGLNLIQKAMELGLTEMVCRVYHMAKCDAEGRAFFKAGMRYITPGGGASCGESVNAIASLANMYIANHPEMFINAHGGARKAGESGADDGNNVIKVIADRLGKKPKTVLWHLKEAENLPPDTLTRLAQGQAPKAFFESIRKPKADMLLKLQARSVSPEQWPPLISEFVQSLFTAFKTNNDELEPKTIRDVSALFKRVHFLDESVAAPPAATPEEGSDGPKSKKDLQQSGAKTKGEKKPESLKKSGDKTVKARRVLSPLDTKKGELTTALVAFLEEVNSITDQDGIVRVSRGIMEYGFRLCSEVLVSEELEATIEELRAKTRE
jgi:hypothetical protein